MTRRSREARREASSCEPPIATSIGSPVERFQLAGPRVRRDDDVSSDGIRFLAIVTDQLGEEQPLTAAMNRRAGAAK